MGNSEVGHMNLGAGRVVFQNLVRINMATENGTFKNRKELWNAMQSLLYKIFKNRTLNIIL